MKVLLIVLLGLSLLAAISTAAVVASTQEPTNDEKKQIILSTIPEDCHQPKEIGRCFALFHRYAFNVETLECEEFIYGGCAGNENNFETLEECNRKCLKIELDSQTEPNQSTTENVNVKSVNESQSSK